MGAPFHPTRDLTSSRGAALAYIKTSFALRGQGPSARDVAGAIGADKETGRKLLRRLEQEKLILWRRGQHGQRSEILPADPQDRISLPDALEALRRSQTLLGMDAIGELLRAAYPLAQSPLPIMAVLSHLDHVDVAVGTGADEDDADCAAGDSR